MTIRIFNQVEPWPSKVNFVCSSNMIVGYDMSQCCCEHAGWYITETEPSDDNIDTGLDMENESHSYDKYHFDSSYFREGEKTDSETSWASFRMSQRWGNSPDLYLVLFNSHNGYYSHGFDVMTETNTGGL